MRLDFVFLSFFFLRTHTTCCKYEAALPHLPLYSSFIKLLQITSSVSSTDEVVDTKLRKLCSCRSPAIELEEQVKMVGYPTNESFNTSTGNGNRHLSGNVGE